MYAGVAKIFSVHDLPGGKAGTAAEFWRECGPSFGGRVLAGSHGDFGGKTWRGPSRPLEREI